MKIYNEKEQTEHDKLQNVNYEEKKSTRKKDGVLCSGDKWLKK